MKLICILFFAFQFAEYDLQHGNMTQFTVLYVACLLIRSVLCGFALGAFLEYLPKLHARLSERVPRKKDTAATSANSNSASASSASASSASERPAKKENALSRSALKLMDSRGGFFLSWLVIFLCWLPYELAYYPGVCAYDAYIQIGQCISGQWNEHHPFLHTMLLNLFWQLGGHLKGGVTTGIGLFVLFQMLLLSLAFAGSVRILRRHGLKQHAALALLLIAALWPYNAFIAISVTKACLFSAALIPAGTLLLLLLRDGENSYAWTGEDWLLFCLLFPVIFFRNNARYAVAAALFACLIALLFSKTRKRLYARLAMNLGGALVIGLTVLAIVFQVAHITQGDRREMLSIPIQQFARTAKYHEAELTDEELTDLSEMILNEAWRDYNPTLADPVKRHFNTYFVVHQPSRTAKLYLGLLAKYPEEFVGAVLAVDAGYLYVPDRTCLEIYDDSGESGLGFVQTRWAQEMYEYGVEKRSVLPGLRDLLERLTDENTLQRIPVLGPVFLPGYVLWAYLFLIAYLIRKRSVKTLPALILPLAYLGTLILGPTVQMRYLYPVWMLLPAVFVSLFPEVYRSSRI